MESFSRPTATWFADAFAEPTAVQRAGWEAIRTGRHALLVAPTGSGKTLAALLWAIDRVASEPRADSRPGIRVLYISPLKALVHDVERNLRAPLAGIERAAEHLGADVRRVRADVRTGDTPQKERARQRRDPPDILVTTPESLFLLLGSAARANLAGVETVIVDEVHALFSTKRGVHLALSLERLTSLCEQDPQRVGLSATVRPLEAAARYLGGEREVEVIDVSEPPSIELEVRVPVEDMQRAAEPRSGSLLAQRQVPQPQPSDKRRGIWPAIHPELVRLVREHRSTILFVQSRGLCERLAQELNDLAGEPLVRAHHGSVSAAERSAIEEALKAGALPGIVATSSLELGIDMGAVDLVVLVESPGSVARGLQRVGRSGHAVGQTSRGIIFPKFKGDLLECAAVAGRMLEGAIEAGGAPSNALDVLAQQIVAMVCDAPRSVDEIEQLVKRAEPYRGLTRALLVSVLDMLTGRYPCDDFGELRPRLSWDRSRDVLRARRGAQLISRLNAGTIPDRGLFGVFLGGASDEGTDASRSGRRPGRAGRPGRIGELDEELVHESRVGDVILLGATSWRIREITRDQVFVEPAPGEPGRLPFWHGDGLGRSVELGRAIGALLRGVADLSPEDAARRLQAELPLDALAARNLAQYVSDQREHTGSLPTDERITVERFPDELGDWRLCILTPFGARVHAPWALALRAALSARTGRAVAVTHTDDGIVLALARDPHELGQAQGEAEGGAGLDPFGAAAGDELETLFPDPDRPEGPEGLEQLVRAELGHSALFAARFRENAARALLLPRQSPRARTPLWAQRLKAKNLLGTVQRYPDFPIVLETYRECLRDVFDLPALTRILRAVRERSIGVDFVETRSPSPFARSLVFSWVATYMYEYDAPLAERRARALTLDMDLLRELLGEAELRELLDREVLEEVEAELARTAAKRRARDADELFDVLREVGALSQEQLALRSAPEHEGPAGPQAAQAAGLCSWLAELEASRRAGRIRLAGREVWIAAQDAGLYRDALGCQPPAGLPDSDLASVPDALTRLLARAAGRRGPFEAGQLADALGLRVEQLEPQLETLLRAGKLVRGALRPGGREFEWCDAEVLKSCKRRTLAKLRAQVAAVEAPVLARFLRGWQGVRREPWVERRAAGPARRRGSAGLFEALRQLEGLALPWSSWPATLARRVPDFRPELLDLASASGELVWVGRGALGPRDGRVALYTRESAARLVLTPDSSSDVSPQAQRILQHLEQRGASFTVEIERALRGPAPELPGASAPSAEPVDWQVALWELVWAGVISNDTFGPLHSLAPGRRMSRVRVPGRGARRGSGSGATLAGGRWSLVRELVDAELTATERAHATALMLLERYGVVAREMAQFEELPGGFGSVYAVLRSMEQAGRIRRGLFVEGLGAAQFALPAAVERLRREREQASASALEVLDAADPANPWGALLAWPATTAAARPRRVPGALLLTAGGAPVLWLSSTRRALVSFAGTSDELLDAALDALQRLPGPARRGRSLLLEKVDGEGARDTALAARLSARGFVLDYRGWVTRDGCRSSGADAPR